MRILNLYSGIGGNRALWGDEHEVTAVEHTPIIAEVYKDYFPNDTVIVGDAHQYLMDHFEEFDFIWSSPPCQSHTRINTTMVSKGSIKARYPDMKLYQEIIFLGQWFKGLWVVENVVPYYQPLIPGRKVDRHLYWSNFRIGNFDPGTNMPKGYDLTTAPISYFKKEYGFNLDPYNFRGVRKDQIYHNCVHPRTGEYVLNCALQKEMSSKNNQLKLL